MAIKIKDLIKHLQTLDQEKQLVIIGTDPTDWDYGLALEPEHIQLETITPTEENGLEGQVEVPKADIGEDDDEEYYHNDEVECYVIRFDC